MHILSTHKNLIEKSSDCTLAGEFAIFHQPGPLSMEQRTYCYLEVVTSF